MRDAGGHASRDPARVFLRTERADPGLTWLIQYSRYDVDDKIVDSRTPSVTTIRNWTYTELESVF